MSNSQAQGSQGPPQGQQGQSLQLLKAEDIVKLQCLSPDLKQKYKPAMENFWHIYQTKPAGSQEHTQAKAKLTEFSQKLISQERAHRMKVKQQQQHQQQQQQHQHQQSSQQTGQNQQMQQSPQPGNAPPQQQQQQQTPQTPAQPPQSTPQLKQEVAPQPVPAQAPQQANRPPGAPQNTNQIDPSILKHVMEFQITLPPGSIQPGTPEGENKIKELRNTYMMALNKQHRANGRLKMIHNMMQQREKSGQPVAQDILTQKQVVQNEYDGAKKYVDEWRSKQQQWKAEHERRNSGAPAQPQRPQVPGAPNQQPQQPLQSQPQQSAQAQQPPQVKQEPQIKTEGGPQSGQHFGNIGSAGGVPQHPLQQVSAQQVPQPRPQPAQHSQLSHPNQAGFSQGGQQQPPQQIPRPQINPHVANAHAQQQQHHSPHPQSATSAGPPVPLTHQAAVSAAQRSYSQPDQRTNTPLQPGQGNFQAPGSREREQLNPKQPIPRTLSVTQPVPVGMGQARPTMNGPTNGAPGPMGQPVISKYPAFQLEGEGDRVLSKRKLDELVRQVTGGAEDALTPEVEETMLMLADDFVDTVIGSACKLAKLRESPQLEIRDLQLVLERNYNIRIPGFASDEVRTVRKVMPAPGWQQKLQAVNSAKVMNSGKTDI